MPKAIKLSDQLVADATKYAKVFHRSPPKQIEHWATIGKITEENPGLPVREETGAHYLTGPGFTRILLS